MNTIRNTTEDMKDPANKLLLLAEAMPDGTSAPIERMEADGQRQLVTSDQLPVDIKGGREAFETLGFTFGDPDPKDPIFMPATLPAGWSRKASDHSMWSDLVDELGRARVKVFSKASFYDRSAYMRLVPLSGYAYACVADKTPVVTDDTWATVPAVLKALQECLEEKQKRFSEITDEHAGDLEYWRSRLNGYAEDIAHARALIDELVLGADSEASA